MVSQKVSREVVIVGGGPAGLAAAIALQKKGFSCTIADTRQPPVDKTCGEGLLPDAVHSLEQLGLKAMSFEGQPFRGIRFLDQKSSVQSAFADRLGIGIRRPLLHNAIIQRANSLGIEILWGTVASQINNQSLLLHDLGSRATTEVQYKWLIGADGQMSTVRRCSDLNSVKSLETRYGFRQHYKVCPWTDYVEVHWAACGQIYITPVGPEEVGIALCTRDARLRVSEALTQFPSVERRLRNAEIISRERGAITTTRILQRVTRGRTALVGDASGSVDAVTGEGLALAFRQAIVLSDALHSGDLSAYERAHRQIVESAKSMARMLLLLDKYPYLRENVFAVLASSPQTFSRLLSVHIGEESLWQCVMSEVPKLTWRLLTA
jgi:2-polyprenyl-6-methoxyphenol hydroxylase-like FAD-dependent oxidoreductase